MRSPFRFGTRKPPPAQYEVPPTLEADAWEMLRGPPPDVAGAADQTLPDAEVAPPVVEAPAPAVPPGAKRQPDLPARVGALKTVAGGAAAYAGPNRIEAWRDIRAVETVGRPADPHRLRLHLPLQSPPNSVLYEVQRLPEHITAAHRARPAAPATEFYGVPGHELGGLGLLQQGGRVWVNDAVQPPSLNAAALPDRLALPEAWTGSLLRPDAEIIETDTPVGVALHPGMSYGNFLLEMLPRLLLLAHLRALGRPLPVAVPSDAPQWLQDFVGLIFDADETIRYDSRRQRVRAPCFVLPNMMQADYHFNPEMNALVEALLGRVVGPRLPSPRPAARFYLSRRLHRGRHNIENEAEVEQALAEIGFEIVHPQQLPLPEQLALYAGAECIVADGGGTAHNALFAPRGAGLMCVGWRDRAPSGVTALRGQPLALVAPEGGFGDPAEPRLATARPPRLDCVELVELAKGFLKYAEERRQLR